VCAIYLPEGAIAIAGEEGLPVVFNSTGESAIGMYFRDSINGPRGKHDMWFGNESCRGGFYVKKSGLKRGDIVKVYYMLPAEAVVESMNITIPKTEEVVSNAVFGKGGYRLIVADEEYVRFARKMVVASVVALLVGVAAVVYAGLRR